MTTESTPTNPRNGYDRWEQTPLAAQRVALAALDRIVELHPDLPSAYIILSNVHPGLVEVQISSWPAFEAWRVALNVPPTKVQLGNCEPEREHLQFEATVDEARVRVYSIGALVEKTTDCDALAVSA